MMHKFGLKPFVTQKTLRYLLDEIITCHVSFMQNTIDVSSVYEFNTDLL